jgi:succinate-semialdehyde dehydrogenase / glutarate-semialdehyde dehydrogenase
VFKAQEVCCVSIVASPAHGPRALPPTGSARIDRGRLDALATRVTAVAPREPMDIEKPFTGETLGRVPRCEEDDVQHAVLEARAAQAQWASTSLQERSAIVLRFHDLVLARQDEVLDLIQLESGKARRHASEEVLDVAIVSRYYANTAARHLCPQRRRGALPLLTATWEHRHPLGVVAIIAPWNYPLTLGISDAIPALIAGNGVVIKPDGHTPFSALWAMELLEEAGIPRGLIQVVTGSGAKLGPHLIDRVDYVMFTGSTHTGRTVARQAADRLIACSMELGGKNAMIVLEDADIGKAVEGAERALFSNAGQLCIAIERLYVHEAIADEYVRRLVEHTGRMRLGTELEYGPDMGSLISAEHLKVVRGHVEDAVAKGARVLTGGRPRPDLGPHFYEPTMLQDVRNDMSLFADETFGPVAAISTFASEDEVVARVNESVYGLNFSVWTRDSARGRALATRLHAGTVNVNEGYAATWASVDAPMGGFKQSGLGRRHGRHGIQKYTEEQTISVQRLLPLAPPPPMSQKLWVRLMTQALRLLRRVPGVR